MVEVINVCNDGEKELASFTQIVNLQKRCLLSDKKKIILTFKGCEFLSPNALTILGSLPILIQKYEKELQLDLASIDNFDLTRYLFNSGFYNFCHPSLSVKFSGLNSIAFKKFNISDKDNTEFIFSYIQDIIKLIPVKMDENLEPEITSKIYEIFRNAFDHSESQVGLFSCGHYYKSKGTLNFCLYDAGIGIPETVRKFLGDPSMKSSETLQWALHSGNSTVVERDYPRGVGLDLLCKFIRLNGGFIKIFSDDSICYINKEKDTFEDTPASLIGTLVNIEIKSDSERIYKLIKKGR